MEEKIITIASYPYSRAQLLKGRLEAEGIECFLSNINLVQPDISTGVKVKINDTDADLAFKIIDEIQFPQEKLRIFGVDRKKESFEGDITSMNIELVPTFIFYENEKEIGRIIETPEISLESDMLKIFEER